MNHDLDSLISKKAKIMSQIERQEKKIDRLENEARTLANQIREICNGTCNNVKLHESYFPGSYLDRAYTEQFKICDICGYHQDLPVKRHNWYG